MRALCWLIVPIFIVLARYLQTKNKVYELTTERLKITEGVFSKVTDQSLNFCATNRESADRNRTQSNSADSQSASSQRADR